MTFPTDHILYRAWQKVVVALTVALLCAVVTPVRAQDAPAVVTQLTLGVLANEGATRAIEAWSPTQDMLNEAAAAQELPYRFKIEPHSDASLLDGLSAGQVDLFIGDAAAFAVAEVEEGARALLSLAHMWNGTTYDKTGAVVFVRSDSDILRLSDIPGRNIMGVNASELTGWQLALQEFRKNRLAVDRISDSAIFSVGNQREVVYAVQNGLVDVGVIRAGVLEMLAEQGTISMADFRPIAPMNHVGFPFWASTPLYPDWVMASMPSVPDNVLALLIDTLLRIDETSAASIAANGVVWQAPQNYQDVHQLLISLRARPYENHLAQAARRIYQTYQWPILGLVALILGSFGFMMFEIRRAARLKEAQKDVLRSEVRSKQFYRNAIEDHTVFCMLTKDGAISHVNERFLNVLDRTRSSVVNSQLSDLLRATNQELLEGQIMDAMQAGAPWQGALQLIKEDGKSAWVQSTFIPVTGTSNKLSEIAIVASDVTKTREGISETRMNDTLELIQDKVVVLRPGDLQVLHMNTSAQEALVGERMGGDWKGKFASDFITGDDLDTLKLRCEAIEDGPQRRLTWEAEGKDDVTYEISLEYAQPDQDEPRIIAIYRDVSERKVIEKVKNEFIATVSHELRTPLTSIKGALGLATSGAMGEVPEKMHGVITMAASSCDRLVMLINDILDLEKIEAGKMDFSMQFLDAKELLDAALESNAFYAEKFGTAFELKDMDPDETFMTYGDASRLTQVLDNVMSNAAKFSHPDSKIVVALRKTPECLRLTIRDYGDGIPEHAQATIFDKFTQADSSDTRSKGGTGLGLSIVKLIVEHHKGRVYFVSKEGEGTEFFIDLPVVEGEQIMPIPNVREEIGRPTTFTDAVTDVASPEAQTAGHRFIDVLIDMVRKDGVETEFELGRTTAVTLASEDRPEAASTAWNWLDSDQRSFLRDLTDGAHVDDREVCVVELIDLPDAASATAERNTNAAKLSLNWFEACAGMIGGSDAPVSMAVAQERKLRANLLGQGIVPLAEVAQAMAHPTLPETDVIMHFGSKDNAATMILYPKAAGQMPADWPILILVSRGDAAQTGRGVVSKFSSGGGRRAS